MYKRTSAYICLAVFCMLATSCATKIAGLTHDPSFTYDTIVSSKIMVGGVASIVNNISATTTIAYSDILRSQFTKQRKELNVVSSRKLVSKLGRKKYDRLMSEHRETGALSSSSLGVVRSKFKGVRYVIFARIEKNETERNIKTRDIYETKKMPNGKKIKVKKGYDITYYSRRKASVSLYIYDLDMGKSVWGGSVNKTVSNSNLYQIRPGRYSRTRKYPDMPNTKQVLSRIFGGFAENLPKAPK